MNRLTFLYKVSRPLGWLIAPLVFFIGLFYSGAELTLLPMLQALLLSFPYCIILYGINDIYDYESDKLNPRKKPIELNSERIYSIKKVSAIVALLLIISSLLTLDISNIAAMVSLLFLSYHYSATPLRFKERPPLDSFSNGALFFIVFAIGFSFGKTVFEIPPKIYFVALCVMGIHSFSTVMDYSADKKAGHTTFAGALGKRTASLFALVVFVSSFLFSKIGNVSINYYFIFCSLLFSIAAIYPSERLASILFKLVFAGFIATAVSFLTIYL